MPDLTIEIFAMCGDLEHHGVTINDHRVEFNPGIGWYCDCKGFKFRKTCRHVAEAEEKQCSWHGAYDEPQAENGVCPRCGGSTSYVRVGV